MPITDIAKEVIVKALEIDYYKCADSSEHKPDVFCILNYEYEPNFVKAPNYFWIGVVMILPLIVWLILRLVDRLGRWVMTGK